MKIGILQTGHAPEQLIERSGNYDKMFQDLLQEEGFFFRTWNVEGGTLPASVRDADGWLITGSRHGAYDRLAWIPPLEDFITDAYTAGIPMVGICFGHQIIAQALGGRVEKFKDGWAVGHQEYDWGGEKVRLNAWHQDQVIERPHGAEVLASNSFCENAVLAYENRALTIQAHPEFESDFVEGLINARGRGNVPDALLDAATKNLGKPIDKGFAARQIGDFFRKAQNG